MNNERERQTWYMDFVGWKPGFIKPGGSNDPDAIQRDLKILTELRNDLLPDEKDVHPEFECA